MCAWLDAWNLQIILKNARYKVNDEAQINEKCMPAFRNNFFFGGNQLSGTNKLTHTNYYYIVATLVPVFQLRDLY